MAKFKNQVFRLVYCKIQNGKNISLELPFSKIVSKTKDKIWDELEKAADECTSSDCVLDMTSINDPFHDGKTLYVM